MKVASRWYKYSLINLARFSYCYRTLLRYTTPPRTGMDHCGGLMLRLEWVVYRDCGPLMGSGCIELEVGHVQLGSFGGRPRGLGIAT